MNAWIQGLPQDKVERYIATHGESLKERYHTDDVYFALWIHHLNREVQRRVGLHHDDLEDWDFMGAYESDCNPRVAAEDMLDDLGYDLAYSE